MRRFLIIIAISSTAAGCGSQASARSMNWAGTVDTLSSGHIVVRNTAEPVWPTGSEWRIEEELRIGSLDSDGPELFGRINSIAVDDLGRIWVLEAQAQELRVFDKNGEFVRNVGRRSGGPGEFTAAVHMALGSDRNLWVMDPRNNRISVIDTAGTFIESKWASGGFMIMPWPGGFDGRGRYYAPFPGQDRREFRIGLLRYDPGFEHADTIELPSDPITRDFFAHEIGSGGERTGSIRAAIPFQGMLRWKISPTGSIWSLVTDQYRMFEIGENGDTIRTITRKFDPLPVTAEERAGVPEKMKWFTDQGGRIELSKVPNTKPPTTGFFIDDENHIWVELQAVGEEEPGRRFDILDPEGRYLGMVQLPFALRSFPEPVFRDGYVYGVTRNELEVEYVVRARVVRP